MGFKKLPFDINFVVEQDLIPLGIEKHPASDGYSINCPFCEKKGLSPDTHHKYSINIYKNVGNCLRCNSGHGILSLHQALSSKPITLQEAKADLMKRWQGLPSDVQIEYSKTKEKLEEENKSKLEPAPIEIRNVVYRKMLSQLTLSKKHYKDLLKRGLTDEEIEKGMYKSVPQIGFKTIASNCFDYETYDQLRRHIRWGIPGFYDIRSGSPKMVTLDNGYFIPIFDEFKRISGFQIRYDSLPDDAPQSKKEHYSKYKWFNSNFKEKKDGCTATGCENIHHAGYWNSSPKEIILTEGVLKADITSVLAGKLKKKAEPYPVLGLTGVYNISDLAVELFQLKQYGLEKINVAVDMDYREKPQVKEALNKILSIIKEQGIKYEMMNWNPKYKGIDDFLLAVYKK